MISSTRRRSIRDAAALAYGRVVEQARQPVFFAGYGVPDTLDGRYELICLHAFLYLYRLKADRPQSAELSQAFFDAMFADLDRALREMGTGDLSVGKHVKRMARGFYGRIRAYQDGIESAEFGSGRRIGAQPFRHRPRIVAADRRNGGICAGSGRRVGPTIGRGAAIRPRSIPRSRRRRAEQRIGGIGRRSMSEVTPEFSRLIPLARLGPEPFRRQIQATADERERLAARFDLVALDRLTAVVTLHRQPSENVLLEAEFEAAFAQDCVITLEPVYDTVLGSFSLLYGPAEEPGAELEPGPDDPVFEALTGDAIDIGEAVAQELSLALPEFPRHPDAVVDAAGAAEPVDSAFAALARLRKPEQD